MPYGAQVGGPDFVTGTGLELLREIWEVAWSPNVDAALVDASVWGSTVEEAATARLRRSVGELEEEGRSRSCSEAVKLVVEACRMGLHRELPVLFRTVESQTAEDSFVPSLVRGLHQLTLLSRAREPLGGERLAAVPRLATTVYHRACLCLQELALASEGLEEKEAAELVRALVVLREVLTAERDLDPDLWLGALGALHGARPAPLLAGAVAGLLYNQGALAPQDPGPSARNSGPTHPYSKTGPRNPSLRLGFSAGLLDDELLAAARGHLDAPETARAAGWLEGLLTTSREVLWRHEGFMKVLDRRLAIWDDETFRTVLPRLRRGLTSLTPNEVDRVASRVATLHGLEDLGTLVHHDAAEADVAFALRLEAVAAEALEQDGLDNWLERGNR